MFKSLSLKVIVFGFIFTFFSSFGQSFFLGLFNSSIREALSISHGQFTKVSSKVIEKDFISMSSMKQWILEEDIGKMCSFLISDDSLRVSGQVISVDGHTERND
ncbi:hypothetical protein OA868_01375 [Candidatus Pelagibacter sp.]|nr:hypothetical protein [Candidatus Pelagibacter sp.]